MNKVPPFIANSADDLHCVPAVYRMLFQHFFDQDFTWEEIDTIGKVIQGKGVWNVPFDIALAKRGIDVTNIELTDFNRLYKEGVSYLKSAYGEKNANYYIEQSNVANIIVDIPEFLRVVHHESRKATIDEILKYLREGKLIAAEVNSAILNHLDKFNLHFVLLYDYDGTHISLHDPGLPPVPSRKVTIDEFTKCFAYPGSGQGIDVFSK